MLRVIESKSKPISEHSVLAEQLEQVKKIMSTCYRNRKRKSKKWVRNASTLVFFLKYRLKLMLLLSLVGREI